MSSQGSASALLILVPKPRRSRGVRNHCADITDGATEPAVDIPSSAISTAPASELMVMRVLFRLRPVIGVKEYRVLDRLARGV